MEHAEVENSHAVERYILNEMGEDERDRFEEHYFDCRVCAAEVTIGTRLLDSGRVIAHEMGAVVPMERRSRLMTWLPLASAAILTILVATLLVPRRSEPSLDVVQPHMLEAGQSRAGETIPELRSGEPAILGVDVPPDPPFPRYEILLRDSHRNVRLRREVTAEQTRETIYLLVRSLPAGDYVLAIEGVYDGNRTEIDTKRLRVR